MTDKYKFCGFEIVPEGESPIGTRAYSDARKLEGLQRGARGAMHVPDWVLEPASQTQRHTAKLRDYQRQTQLAAAHQLSEVFPQDMAIWRAILAGDEWFRIARKDGANLRKVRASALFMQRDDAVQAGGYVRFRHLTYLRLKLRAAPRDVELRFGIWRFVLFTHPFTGGRAVFSEPVD